MAAQLGQVVERIDPTEFAGVDQTHEQVAHASAVASLKEECVLTVEDRLFQRPFAEVVMCALLRHVESAGESPARRCFVPAGSTWGGSGGNE